MESGCKVATDILTPPLAGAQLLLFFLEKREQTRTVVLTLQKMSEA